MVHRGGTRRGGSNGPVRPGVRPRPGAAHAADEFVRCKEALVADAGKLRLHGWECITQVAQCGMAVGLLQRFAADAFSLSQVHAWISGRIIPSGTADGGLPVVDDHQDQGRGPPVAAGPPDRSDIREPGGSRGGSGQDFERRGSIAQGEADGPKRAIPRQADLTELEAGEK